MRGLGFFKRHKKFGTLCVVLLIAFGVRTYKLFDGKNSINAVSKIEFFPELLAIEEFKDMRRYMPMGSDQPSAGQPEVGKLASGKPAPKRTRSSLQHNTFIKPDLLLKNSSSELNALRIKKRNAFFSNELENIEFGCKENEISGNMIKRKGKLLKVPGACATIVVCHGFMCDKDDMNFLRMIFRFAKHPCNIMTFDFRAHGENSNNQSCTLGKEEIFDVLGAVDFVKNNPDTKNLPIIGYGFSMGAATLVQAQSYKKPKKLFDMLILDCPFDSSDNTLKRVLEKVKLSVWGYEVTTPLRMLLQKYVYNDYVQALIKNWLKAISKMDSTDINLQIRPISPYESAKNITEPTFIISCINDDKVPAQAVFSVYKNLNGYKRLWLTNGRRHYDSLFYNPEEYTYKVVRFIDKFLARKLLHSNALHSNKSRSNQLRSNNKTKAAEKIKWDNPDELTLKIAMERSAGTGDLAS